MTDASQQPVPGGMDAPDLRAGPEGRWPIPPGTPATWNDAPWPVPPRPPRRPGRAASVAAAICLVVTVLGAPLGLLWAALAPSVPVRMTDDGVMPMDAQPEEFVAADGWFSLLGLGFGALAAIAVWLLLRRWRGPLSLFSVVLGTVGAGLLAWWVGRQVGVGEYHRLLDSAAAGTVFGKPADLRAAHADLFLGFIPVVRGDVLVPAFGAAVVYTLLAGWSRYASLRPHEEPDVEPVGFPDPSGARPVSSDSMAAPVPPTAPAPPAPGVEAPPPG